MQTNRSGARISRVQACEILGLGIFKRFWGTHMLTKRASAAGVINPARGALAILSFAILGGVAVTPAYAFTDINGRVCATSDLIANPVDPNGPSVCPAGSTPLGKPSIPPILDTFLKDRDRRRNRP